MEKGKKTTGNNLAGDHDHRVDGNKMKIVDPYVAFENWMRANGFSDVVDCEPEEVDLDRLHEAVEIYYDDQKIESQEEPPEEKL